jgi:hypothetical protein
MNFAETYLNSCGLEKPAKTKIIKPESLFYPIPDKYITIHNGSGLPSKNYSFYTLVINQIIEKLKEQSIQIVQVGTREEELLPNVVDYRGKTNLLQCNYVIENSMLHIGNDSCWVHVAGLYNVPSVSIYGACYVQNSKPLYYNPKSIFLSDLGDKKPCYSKFDRNYLVDNIKPEQVSKSVLSILGLEDNILTKTLFINNRFNSPILNIIPSEKITKLINFPIFVRMDITHDENFLLKFLNFCSKKNINVSIICDKEINPNILLRFKKNISSLSFKIKTLKVDKQFIKFVKNNFNLKVIYCGKINKLNDIRFDLLDITEVLFQTDQEKQPDLVGFNFKSSCLYLSNDVFYPSLYHFKNKISENSKTPSVKEKDFWCDLQNYWIYDS